MTLTERIELRNKTRQVYKSAIKESGKKQKEIAKMLGINESRFSMIVNGWHKPTLKQAESIKIFLNTLNNEKKI